MEGPGRRQLRSTMDDSGCCMGKLQAHQRVDVKRLMLHFVTIV